jgi:dTDP-4-amino-4,6-dideoxygalactose transaminase
VNDLDNKKKHAAWLFTIVLEKKDFLQKKLRDYKIETNQVHFRNDRYSIFKKYVQGAKLKNMDYLENKYLVLPLHHKLSVNRTKYICGLINKLI